MTLFTAHAGASTEMTWTRTWHDAVQLQWQPITQGEPAQVPIDNWRPAFSYPIYHSNTFIFGNSVYSGYARFCQHDLDGTYRDSFTIDGLNDVWKTTTDGTYCYMIEYEKRGIFVVDIEQRQIVRMIPTAEHVYFLEYVASLDGGKGGFIVGDPFNLYCLDMEGARIHDDIDLAETLGENNICQDITVVGDYLYILGNANDHIRKAYQYDFATLTFTGKTFDLHDFVGEADVQEAYYPRTITHYSPDNVNTYIMFVDYSGADFIATSLLVEGAEISDQVAGYSLYRNGEKLTAEPLAPTTGTYTDASIPEQGQVYQYELRAVNPEGAEAPVATTFANVDDTRSLPMDEEFAYIYPGYVIPGRLANSYTEAMNDPESPAWTVFGNFTDNNDYIQYYHGNDLDFAQTLVSRPLKAADADNVKIAIYYTGNNYMQGLSEERMNVDVLVAGSEEWVNVGSVTYKAQYGQFTEAIFDATEAVQGREFRFRLRASGVEGAPTNYNWQISRIKAWGFHPVDLAGQVTYAGQPLNAPVELTATMNNIGTIYYTTTDESGNFTLEGVESGDYNVVIARGGMTFATAATIDASSSDFVINVPGGRLTSATTAIDATMGSRSKRSFEIPMANEGDATASVSVEFIPTGNVSAPEFGSIDATDQFAMNRVIEISGTNSNQVFYLNGKFYQKSFNYSAFELNELDTQGNIAATIALTYDTEGVNHSISGVFSTGTQLYVYTAARAWSEPKDPAYIIPVDLEAGTILDSQKLAIDLSLTSINSVAYNAQNESFYVIANSAINRLNADGSLAESFPIPDPSYRSMAFDCYSVGGPYLWMVKSSYSPVGFILGKYSFEAGAIVETFDANLLPGNILASGNNMISPQTGFVQISPDVVPGFQSMVFMQVYNSRTGQNGSQTYVLKLYPTETWLTLNDSALTLDAGNNATASFTLQTDGLADGEQKQCNIVISSNNFCEDVVVPVTLTYDVNAESDYPGATNLAAALSANNQAVQLTWDSAATANEVSRYIVVRNEKYYAQSESAGYLDAAPLYGPQAYQVIAVYADGTEVASEPVAIDFAGDQWGASVSPLEATTTEQNVTLTWNAAPAYRTGFFTDLQAEQPFSIDGPQGWKLVDGDRAFTFSNQNVNYNHEGERMAAIIYAPNLLVPADPDFADEPEDCQMLAFTSGNVQQIPNDDWVISPRLDFDGTLEISFRLRTRNAGYGNELLAVEYSMTDDNLESFQRATLITTNSATWQHFTVEIPAGAHYVALHYLSQYIYQLFVDDIYVGAAGQFSPFIGFNLYRNEEKLNDEPLAVGTFDDLNLDFGTYTYTVETLYENGATGQASTTVVIEDTGAADMATGQAVIRVADRTLTVTGGFDHLAICTASGIVITQHAATAADFTLSLADFAPGIYLITVQRDGTTQAAKVILTR